MISRPDFKRAKESNLLSYPYCNIYEAYYSTKYKDHFQDQLTEILKNNSDPVLSMLATIVLIYYDQEEIDLAKELLDHMDSYARAKGNSEEC